MDDATILETVMLEALERGYLKDIPFDSFRIVKWNDTHKVEFINRGLRISTLSVYDIIFNAEFCYCFFGNKAIDLDDVRIPTAITEKSDKIPGLIESHQYHKIQLLMFSGSKLSYFDKYLQDMK